MKYGKIQVMKIAGDFVKAQTQTTVMVMKKLKISEHKKTKKKRKVRF